MAGSNTEDLLAGRSGLKGISIQSYTVDEAGLNLSSVPANAMYALIVLEAYSLADGEKDLCCRWSDTPAALEIINDTVGFPIGHLGMIELRGKDSIANFAIKTLSTILSGYPQITVGFYE